MRAHVCINFAPTPASWDAMVAAIRPRGRIIAAPMVSQPVPLSQEWLTASGVWITGTSVGTRAQMRELIQLHEAQPFETQVQRVTLAEATSALALLKAGNAEGRQAIVFGSDIEPFQPVSSGMSKPSMDVARHSLRSESSFSEI
ncbi:hypothetical protein MES5069_1320021 [Mesorhizobium escarrei]|uniref:Zinc-binding dehydrogenase n=1 Tax=Mesorhizobium escarrei TaxID=666018 RepID=A0ABM9DIP6_9HYPH|nr:hypothetical protein MES5069_1320021 [Mesorhizobium escarrei]